VSRRIAVINNTWAGKRHSRSGEVRTFLKRHPEIQHRETHDDHSVPQALREFEEAGVEVLVLVGGDGTVQHTLTRLLGEGGSGWMPLIAPLPGGSTNATAIDLGTQRSAVRGLAALIQAALEERLAERIVERSVLRVALPDEVRFGMVFGAGMFARAVSLTHQSFPQGRLQGAFGTSITLLVQLSRAARGRFQGVLALDKMQIRYDREPELSQEVLLSLVTTNRRLILGLNPFWGQEPAPLRVTTVEGRAEHAARAIPGILRGRPQAFVTPERGYTSRNVHQLELCLDAALVLDGELLPPTPDRRVRISAVEGVRFLRA